MAIQCVPGCVRCCEDKGSPVELTLADLKRLKAHLRLPWDEFYDRYCEILWNRVPASRWFIPAVGLRFPCAFLAEGRCRIYSVRPIRCQLFPERLFINGANPDMRIYQGNGYRCLELSLCLTYIEQDQLLDLIRQEEMENRETAAYFENSRLAVKLSDFRLTGIARLLEGYLSYQLNQRRRELCTGAILAKVRGSAEGFFRQKLQKFIIVHHREHREILIKR